MSTPKKLRAGTESELTRLKKLWRSLSEEQREFWRCLFVSDAAQATIRQQLAAELEINLKWDSQLNAFRDWELQQRTRELEAERMQEDERRITQEFGDQWTLDQIREEVLKRSYARSISTGDFKQGLATAKVNLHEKRIEIDARRVAVLEKKAAAYDQAAQVNADQTLSAEEKQARFKQIFGLA